MGDGRIRARRPGLPFVDLTVNASEFVSVIGPSGCGKSTLLMIVAGLISPTAGLVHVAGARVLRPLSDVGIVFQSDLLFDWRTVLGNVAPQAGVGGQGAAQVAGN